MISFSVKVDENVTLRSEALRKAYDRGHHLEVIGNAAAIVVKKNFRKLDSQRHRGTTTLNFYGKAHDATSSGVQNRTAFVSIDQEGIALRRFGGTIKPRTAKYLTIPVADEAHGRRVREFGNDVKWIINRRKGTGVVLLGGKVLFALAKSSTHKADPSVLPTDSQIGKQVVDDLKVWTDLVQERG